MNDFVTEFLSTPYREPPKVAPKPKGKRRPEDVLQEGVATYLKRALPRTAWFCAIPNGAVLKGDSKQRSIQMARLKATGLKVGAPDLMVFYNSRALAIELKVDGALSDSQQRVQVDLEACGVPYTVARTIDNVQDFLAAQGVPLLARVR
jgi:hypothetical protein